MLIAPSDWVVQGGSSGSCALDEETCAGIGVSPRAIVGRMGRGYEAAIPYQGQASCFVNGCYPALSARPRLDHGQRAALDLDVLGVGSSSLP